MGRFRHRRLPVFHLPFFIHSLGDVLQSKTASPASGGNAYQTAFFICLGAVLASLALYATTRDTAGELKYATRSGS
ncbi:MAG: hypothetical protein JRK53_17635 [Deltaproteobacteria bacterium]|nr:hypothetical protein [Deltaproteobacteria bacterium]